MNCEIYDHHMSLSYDDGQVSMTAFDTQLSITIEKNDNDGCELEIILSIAEIDALIHMLESSRQWQMNRENDNES